MPTILDQELSILAPNIVVQVATPPPYSSTNIDDSLVISQLAFDVIDIASKGNWTIIKDQTKSLAEVAQKGNLLYFHIKIYGNVGKILSALPPPPLPPPPLPPPPLPPSPTASNTSDARGNIPSISEANPFTTIDYVPSDLVGVTPPKNVNPPPIPPSPPPGPPLPPGTPTPTTPPPQGKAWDPLVKSSQVDFQNFPSAIYVPAIQSCISTPYFSPEAKRHLNGVMNNGLNPTGTTYQWEVDLKATNRDHPHIRPKDGRIILHSQPKDRDSPYADIFLEPGKWERKVSIKNGDTLNAFSLILGIQPGGNENQVQAAIWTLEIIFGDITLKIVEGTSEIEVVTKAGTTPSVPTKIAIKPSTASFVTQDFGTRPYLLTFIPVWNGLLLSHGVPSSSDWGSTITFIPKDKSLNINTQITDLLSGAQTTAELKPKRDSTGAVSGAPDKNANNPFPPQITVTRDDKKYKAPGIFIKGKKLYGVEKRGTKVYDTQSIASSDFDTGTKLTLRFSRCGGSFKFVPLYFPPYSRYHYLLDGAADPRDIPKESPTRKPKNDSTGAKSPPKSGSTNNTTIPNEPDVFKVKSAFEGLVLPIINFSADPIDFRVNYTTIVKSASKPFSCMSMEFRNVNTDVRRPIQVWGSVLAEDATITQSLQVIPPVNGEGVLTVNDMPALRIRRFSISRALDGANGEIVWDRNDPLLGLLPRPPQNIGAIQVGITGGANTVDGVVFTGLALGNSQEDAPEENFVRIPLRGREAKLDSDGGIVLVNAPFMDGMDHRDAMAFLANYAGVPIDSSLATPFRLISSLNIRDPILDFPMGTGVSQAMDTITKESTSLFFFDRFGTLIHIDAQTSTGVNWDYPDVKLETFSDEPDFQWMRNEIIIYALVAKQGALAQVIEQSKIGDYNPPTEVVMVRVPVTTVPNFPWSRMAVYTIPQIVQSRSEVTRLASRIAEGVARPRATSRCQVPPNANIELLDLLNNNWIITSISHEADTQSKRWTMTLGVELFVDGSQNVGTPELLPLTNLQ